jgi:biopolymer transport protein ExbD
MRLSSPIPHKRARIEIIPLIDIMFFLLASFMMVSLSQTHMKGIRVNLPAAIAPPPSPVKDYVSIKVQEGNVVYFDNQPVTDDQVLPRLYELHRANPDIKVSISASLMAMHGDVITVLDKVRSAGIKKVGYQIRAAGAPGARPGGAAPPPPKP